MQCILLVLLSLCFFNCISLVSLHRRKEQTTKAFDNVFKFIFKWIFSNAFVLFVVPSMTRQFVCLFLTISPPSVYLAALLFGAVGKLCPTFRLNKITFFFYFFLYIHIYIYMYAVHTPLFQPPQRSFICTKAQTKRKNVFRGLHETARHKNTFLRNFILIFYEQEKQKKKKHRRKSK